ncbi:MAG: tetraacyldisaccharide 4'-kinase [Candidatus Cloacimonetes bacterium]|nr:tetraacyldisaccharide 4'-kinase [Candidatus Cloacimonadota bacterium]
MQRFVERSLYRRSLLSCLLWPLSILFSCIVILRRYAYHRCNFMVYRSRLKIICVGNIVSGGSGKTPFTIFLARFLKTRGLKVAVSHRGYKGAFENEIRMISTRREILPQALQAGDEALLLARNLEGIPVVCGRSRRRAIRILEKEYPDLDFVILDDSFQHLQVYHDLDFVLFNSIAGAGNGFVLPAGILREPVSVLKHADFIIYNGVDSARDFLRPYQEKVLSGKYSISGFYNINMEEISLENIRKMRLALISAIGYPPSFAALVNQAGIAYIKHNIYPDHCDYNDPRILLKLQRQAKEQRLDCFLTTEKDFVKLRTKETALVLIMMKIEFVMDDICLASLEKAISIRHN